VSSKKKLNIQPEEEAILIHAAQRDPSAFASLYRVYVGPVYRYLYSRLGHVEDAEDLTSQVFMEALEGLPGYRHKDHFAAWLFTIARHKCIDYWRRRKDELPLEDARGFNPQNKDLLVQVVRSEEIRQLEDQYHKLEESEWEILRLRFVADLSYAEIADLSGKSMEATKKQVYRLLDRLRDKMEIDHE
jgi:RNA polymerase sigma-70 factor, ECF subfamily